MARFCIHCDALLDEEAASSVCPRCGAKQAGAAGEKPPLAEEARASAPGSAGVDLPERIGRFRIVGTLGVGSFATVYRGRDDELDRDVAIKLMHARYHSSHRAIDRFLSEGRTLAGMDHPGIVPVYDLGRLADGRGYFVVKLVVAGTLRQRMEQGRLPRGEAVEIIAQAAEALHHAHEHKLVHRDVKPENILFDHSGRILVADFGLALREEEFGTGPEFVGTIRYMSPEQARCEGHRVDARSDIYSLGVVFFELLTGQPTFPDTTRDGLLAAIASREVRSPRTLDDSIPPELERISLKALAHRPSDRYRTAADLAADLRHWQTAGSREKAEQPVRVVPRGLRAFREQDAESFLELLPGPRDREGLPESIAFWKANLECAVSDRTFRVGLLYGPSGCGKSSLLKAGLMPRLGPQVTALYLEATPDQTEAQLLKLLRHRFPKLPPDLGLPATLEHVRRGQGLRDGGKVVLLLDQFEQWLHANQADEPSPLVQALRQCDGSQVQCLLLVRDDFWLSVSRFMQQLEIPVQEGINSALVDLFDLPHARKVLLEYGKAFRQLPGAPTELSKEQNCFLDRAIEDLAEDGKVIAVRLSLFAEMVKARPWTLDTLDQLGGFRGIGVAFLEETFSTATAPAAHRQHEKAAQAVLQTLLPEAHANLKGHRRSFEELRVASGYAQRPQDFLDLLRILDPELRLITPADESLTNGDSAAAKERSAQPSSSRLPRLSGNYQLTHDYLVPALREWLTRKQRGTRRGRAELRLAERSGWWNSQPERRQLPGWWEWANISLFTNRRQWTAPQRAMMRAATRTHLVHGVAALLAALLLFQGWRLARRWQTADLAALHAADQVAQLRSAPLRNVPEIIAALKQDWAESEPRLRAAIKEADLHPRQLRNLRLALVHADPEQVQPLGQDLLSASPDELMILRQSLLPYRAQLTENLWRIVTASRPDAGQLIRAAGALALFDPESPRWATVGNPVVAALLQQSPLELKLWLDVFRPIRQPLLPSLELSFRKPIGPSQLRLVAVVLADYASDRPILLANLLLSATPEQYALLWPSFQKYGEQAIGRLTEELIRPEAAGGDEEAIAESARRQAQAAVMLLQLGQDQHVWPLLRQQPDPTVRTNLIYLLAALGTEPQVLAQRWRLESDAGVRKALILSLGESDPTALEPKELQDLVAQWLQLYRDHPDPGLHGAIDWTLRHRWKQGDQVRAIDAVLAGQPHGPRRWFVNRQEQTFVVVAGGAELRSAADQPATRIPRSFAVSVKDVTVADFGRFQKAHPSYRYPDFPTPYIDGDQSPMIWLTWFDAAAYCRWLSEQEKVPEHEMCYPPLDQIKPGMKMPADYLSRTGYRLPTAVEWQYAARAGTTTPRFFGRGEALVAQFGWYAGNAAAHVRPVGRLKPNEFGLFDVYGNVWEWNQDRAFRPPAAEDVEDASPVDGQVARLVLGGSFADQAFALTSTSFIPRKPTECHVQYGMRLARTVR